MKIIKYLLNKLFIIVIIVSSIIVFNSVVKDYKKQIKELNSQIEYYKQAANPSKETIDSLVYNIKYRDSIIYNIKYKYIKDVEIIKNMPDSVVVDIFNKLVWSE